MSKGNTARTNYVVARTELVERIRLREQVLLVYLAVIGTIFGIALENFEKNTILLIIPFIAFGCSILVSQHNSVIGTLLHFCSHEIKPFLESIDEYAPQFGVSMAFKEHSKRSNYLRSFGHAIIIIIPCFVALIYNIHHAISPLFSGGFAWWFALICTVFSIGIIHYVHKLRSNVYKETNWD